MTWSDPPPLPKNEIAIIAADVLKSKINIAHHDAVRIAETALRSAVRVVEARGKAVAE